MSVRSAKPEAIEKNEKKKKNERMERNNDEVMSNGLRVMGKPVIYRSMRVAEILALLPDSASLLAQYGLSCFSCSANATETLEEGCMTHGFSDADLDDLVTDLNVMIQDKPERPQTISVTKEAALQLKEILTAEGKAGWGLSVGLDSNGGFSMDVVEEKESTDLTFVCNDVSDVPVYASPMTLFSIGGATIDFRDGRFKLDLPDEALRGAKSGCCQGEDACECGGGECGCH